MSPDARDASDPTPDPTPDPATDPATDPPPGAVPESPPEHRDDGLDLARALARQVARMSPTAKARKRAAVRRPRTSGRVSGAHPDERDPQTLENTVGRLLDDHGWDLDLRVAGVFARWPDIVGPDVGAHSTPESLAEGRLVVRTDSTAWATQLKLLAPAVVRRLNEELGDGTVTLIEVLGPHGPTWKKGPRSVRDGRGPRDTYG